jgi:hypothetical protein
LIAGTGNRKNLPDDEFYRFSEKIVLEKKNSFRKEK